MDVAAEQAPDAVGKTPHGWVQFLQVVGISDEEFTRMKATSTAEVLAELASASPLLVTDVSR